MERAKHKIIFYWLSHSYLRRIGKRYPEYFEKMIADVTDSYNARKVMRLRYTGDYQMKFEAIGIEMGLATTTIFEYHKKVVDALISGHK